VICAIGQPRGPICPIAAKYKAEAVCVFGSRARGEAAEDSDVGLIVGEGNPKFTLFGDFGGMRGDAEKALGKKTDIVVRDPMGKIIPS
jgi:predicted nucleotidyltransferase